MHTDDNIIQFPEPPVARPGSRLDGVLDSVAAKMAKYLVEHREGRPLSIPRLSAERAEALRAELEAAEREPPLPPIVEARIHRIANEVCDRAFRFAASE
jgi:hypothetical protein